MKKRRLILFIAFAAVALAGVAWFPVQPREPSYQGKTLSQWLVPEKCAYSVPVDPWFDSEQFKEAVRHIGTNAIPTALRLAAAEESPLETKALQFLGKVKWLKIYPRPAVTRNYEGEFLFEALGPIASPAVPGLVAIYQHASSLNVKSTVLMSLGYIGPSAGGAVPFLISMTTNRDDSLRLNAADILGRIHARAELSVPALIILMNDSDPVVRMFAVQALRKFKSDAPAAVPALLHLLAAEQSSPLDPNLRSLAIEALKAIDPAAAVQAGFK